MGIVGRSNNSKNFLRTLGLGPIPVGVQSSVYEFTCELSCRDKAMESSYSMYICMYRPEDRYVFSREKWAASGRTQTRV